jgi:hypothetical protein
VLGSLRVLASRHMRLSVIAQRCSLEHSLDTTGGNRARHMKLEEVCFVNRSIKQGKDFSLTSRLGFQVRSCTSRQLGDGPKSETYAQFYFFQRKELEGGGGEE